MKNVKISLLSKFHQNATISSGVIVLKWLVGRMEGRKTPLCSQFLSRSVILIHISAFSKTFTFIVAKLKIKDERKLVLKSDLLKQLL